MIEPHLVAARFDDKPGYDLISYEVVGLPIWFVGLELDVREASNSTLVEQVLVRLIAAGIGAESDLSELSGLSADIVRVYLLELSKKSCIDLNAGSVLCTSRGRELAEAAKLMHLVRKDVSVPYDPLLRGIMQNVDEILWKEGELKASGTKLIRPTPLRKPSPDEIDISDVARFLKRNDAEFGEVVRVLGVPSRRVRYRKGILLAYKQSSGAQVEIEFALDLRISREHGKAFLRQNGICRHGYSEVSRPNGLIEDNPDVLGIKGLKAAASSVMKKTVSVVKSHYRGVSASSNGVDSLDREDDSKGDRGVSSDIAFRAVNEELGAQETRMVSVYEHPEFLVDALDTCQEELIIISPWITSAVVDSEFIKKLESRILSGCTIFLGYGISAVRDRDTSNPAIASLKRLSEKYETFVFRRLGDTHAKILIKDNEFLIASSFNWLSFKGDPKQTFREEWGLLVRNSAFVEQQSERFRNRILSGSE